MKLHVINNIFHTTRHMRPIQIRYQLWYRLRKMWRKGTGFNYPLSLESQSNPIELQPWIDKPVSFSKDGFTFLNLTKQYLPNDINWNEDEHGRLWAYNLNYMDYLLQPDVNKKTGLQLIDNFITNLPKNQTGLEPYPTALRGINWIKFFSKHSVISPHYASTLYAQYKNLLNNIEYHLLGNHLLEDGFSLLFGAFYFKDEKLYNKSKHIIETELDEQILNDGAHFELSPMYHQIILDRLLDCINLVQNNQIFSGQEKLHEAMQSAAKSMLNWLNNITFANGTIPLLNDAAPGIAPKTEQLNNYAVRLGLNPTAFATPFSASGYRKFSSSTYNCIIDIGQIGPSYQPGHAHADTFNFVLNVNEVPIFVDTGISTYNAGNIRLKERGTAAHNTVTVQDKNSSAVWSAFRVARRAKVNIKLDEKDKVIAEHNGYKKVGTIHQREWQFLKDKIEITDTLSGKITEGKAHFWLSPGIVPQKNENNIDISSAMIMFSNAVSVDLLKTSIPDGYNRFSETYKIEVVFKSRLNTSIRIN